MHTNIYNNKKYIGMTGQKPEKRWGLNGYGYIGNEYFYRAIQKYSWDSFNHEILFCNLTIDEAEILEIEIIKHYKSTNPKLGYNIREGGCCTRIADTTREKLRLININRPKEDHPFLGKVHSEETKSKLRAKAIERYKDGSHPVRGKVKSPEQRAILSAIKKAVGKWKGSKNYRARKIICIETNIIYNTIREAYIYTGISERNISAVCRKKHKTAGGYHWEYYENYLKTKGEQKQ